MISNTIIEAVSCAHRVFNSSEFDEYLINLIRNGYIDNLDMIEILAEYKELI